MVIYTLKELFGIFKLKVTYNVYYTCGRYLGACIKREAMAMFKDVIAN